MNLFSSLRFKKHFFLLLFLLGDIYFLFPNFCFSSPSDPYFSKQWYLNRIGFNHVWNKEVVTEEIIVAVIDSGVDIDHPDLKDRIWLNKGEVYGSGIDDDNNGFIDDVNGWNFVDNTPDPRPQIKASSIDDGLNHGTMIAGIIGASIDNNIGISGVSRSAKIMPLRALNEAGEGRVSDVIRAVDYAVNNGADVINLSFSGLSYNQGFQDAIERAYRAGVLVVAAAGNDSQDLDEGPVYPACFQGSRGENIVISVASTDALDQKTAFSSYGHNCVDISAPGISFFSTYFYDLKNDTKKEYDGYWSGTSMSAALVSGSLAFIKSVNPKLSHSEILDVLLKSSDNINALNPNYSDQLGSGRINLRSAVNWASEKWNNIDGRFLIFPYSGIASFESDDFNTLRVTKSKGIEEDSFFLFSPDFKGSVSIAVGDVNGNGREEIVVGAGAGGGPHVRIFDQQGNLLGQFFAYDPLFRGGVNVALGDVNGNGREEIVVGAGAGGGPHVRIFDQQGNLLGQFFAYEESFRGGIKVEVANLYGKETKNRNEIVVSPGQGREPEIVIFNYIGEKINSFLAYASRFKNGVNLAVGDLNKDGLDQIITGAGPGGAPHLRAFDARGNLLESFYGLEDGFTGGLVVSFIEIKN
jgi:hypothetical protein